MIVEGASLCLLYLLIRRRFIFRPLESSGAGFWEVWCMSAYLIIIKFNISYFLGFEPLLFNGSNKRIPIFLVPNSTDLKNCSEFCCAHFKICICYCGGVEHTEEYSVRSFWEYCARSNECTEYYFI